MKKAFNVLRGVLLVALLFAPLVLGATLAALILALPRPVPLHGVAGYITVDLESFENVVAVGTASARWNKVLGRVVDRIILTLGGTVALTKAMISNVRVLANEKVIFEDTGSRIDTRNVYRGITANASFLTLDFNEIRAHSDMNKVVGALDCPQQGIRSLSCEVTTTVGSTAPTLVAQAMLHESPSSGDPRFNRLISKVLNKTWNFGAAGEFAFPLALQRHPLSLIKRVHLFGSTVTAARVKKTGTNNVTDEIFKGTDAQNDFIQTEYGRTPQANQYTIDFMPDGDVREALPLADALSMEWCVTVSGAGNVIVVPELLDPLENN
jgi:hypothetical protein